MHAPQDGGKIAPADEGESCPANVPSQIQARVRSEAVKVIRRALSQDIAGQARLGKRLICNRIEIDERQSTAKAPLHLPVITERYFPAGVIEIERVEIEQAPTTSLVPWAGSRTRSPEWPRNGNPAKTRQIPPGGGSRLRTVATRSSPAAPLQGDRVDAAGKWDVVGQLVLDVRPTNDASALANQPLAGSCGKSRSGSSSKKRAGMTERAGSSGVIWL